MTIVYNWVLFLGGGYSQKPLIQATNRLGYKTCVVDRDPNCAALGYADDYWELSTYDFDAIKQRLARFEDVEDASLVAVIARTSGQALETAAKLNLFLGLPGLTTKLVETFNSKSKTRGFCHQNNIPVPEGIALREGTNHRNSISIEGPWVVRPDYTRVGKESISLCRHEMQLKYAIQKAARSSVNSLADIGQYQEGRDVSTLVAISGDRSAFLVCWEEINHFDCQDINSRILKAQSIHAPITLGRTLEKKVEEYALRISSNDPNVMHLIAISWRLTPASDLCLIEVHLDLTGDRILDELLPAIYGRDLFEPIANWQIKKTPDSFNQLIEVFKSEYIRQSCEIIANTPPSNLETGNE